MKDIFSDCCQAIKLAFGQRGSYPNAPNTFDSIHGRAIAGYGTATSQSV